MKTTAGGRDPVSPDVGGEYRDGAYHALFSPDPLVQEATARQRVRKLARHVRPEDSVFEFGVGTALNLRSLPARERAGYDPYPDAAQLCSRFGVEFVPRIAELAGRTFDIVLCHHVLEHVFDPMATLISLRPLLAPGGRLLLYVPFEFNRRYRRWWPDDPNHHLFSWNALTLGNLVTAAGYGVKDVRVRPYGYEQRLGKFARLGDAVFNAVLWAARLVRPSDEIELIARRADQTS